MREHRVYGPPGTGKTTHLKRRVEATVKQRGVHAIRIASLTRAAAAEIGSRVDLPREYVGTLHAHAYRALQHPQLAEDRLGVRDWNERAQKISSGLVLSEKRVDQALDDAGGSALEMPTLDGGGDALLSAYQTLRARERPSEFWPDNVRGFAEHWEAWKRSSRRLDFSDLIERAITEFPELPGGPSVFLLDEAQDMSRLEMRLARQWGEACEVFVVVGDPDQNLYQWRGSEPEVFEATELDSDNVTVLSQSYRVPRAVHKHAVGWLDEHLGGRRVPYEPRDSPGSVSYSPVTHKAVDELANELEREVRDGRRAMVLTTCGFMLDRLLAVLRDRGVPFANPYKEKHGGWNPLYGAGRLTAFLRPDRSTWGADARPWRWTDVRKWSDPLNAREVFEHGAKTFIESKVTPTELLPSNTEPGDTEADLEVLFELVREEHRDELFDLDLGWYARHLLASRRSQFVYPMRVAEAHGRSALLAAPLAVSHGQAGWPGIIIGTIHSVKGGEADTVYVFPDLSPAGDAGWSEPGWRKDAITRQFYVAFTRARSALVLCTAEGEQAVPF